MARLWYSIGSSSITYRLVQFCEASSDVAITQAVIAMAHSMKMTVIAEGVETRIQAEFLRQNRCDQLQGYYFSRPLPAEAFAELLQKADFGSVQES